MTKSAFTLIELLVVVAIIALLAALGMPGINRAIETSRRATCSGNLQRIGHAMQTYATENDGKYPFVTDLSWTTWDRVLLNRGLVTKSILACPSDKTKRTVPGDKRSYAYNGYFGAMKAQQPNTIEGNAFRNMKAPSDIVVAADCGTAVSVIGSTSVADVYASSSCLRNHNNAGANFLFADGHVEWATDMGSYSGDAASYQLWLKHWRCDLP